MFDPLNKFTETGGRRHTFATSHDLLADHLSAFSPVFEFRLNESLDGTAIRLPLRQDERSELQPKAFGPHDIRQLLLDFIKQELDISLLFLSNLSNINISEIDDNGTTTVLAKVYITRSSPVPSGPYTSSTATVVVEDSAGKSIRQQTWLQVHFTNLVDDYAAALSTSMGYDVHEDLLREKLSPDVALAVPLDRQASAASMAGRLFTFLPLPLITKFSCHIHGLFALTIDRQHLRNRDENVAERSLDRYNITIQLFEFRI